VPSVVGAIDEALVGDVKPCFQRRLLHLRAGLADDEQVRTERGDAGGDPLRHLWAAGGVVVERAVRLYVVHPDPVPPAEALQRPQLVDDVGLSLTGGDVQHPAAEADPVGKAGVRPDLDAGVPAEQHRLVHDARVAGVEAAGQVRRVQQRDEDRVLAQAVVAVALTQVRVQIYCRHSIPSSRRPRR
jgi:hypothetical protein